MIWLSVNLDFFTQNFLLEKFYFSVLWFIGGITTGTITVPLWPTYASTIKLSESSTSPPKCWLMVAHDVKSDAALVRSDFQNGTLMVSCGTDLLLA